MEGETDMKGGPDAFVAVDSDLPAVSIDHVFDDLRSQPRPAQKPALLASGYKGNLQNNRSGLLVFNPENGLQA